MRTGSQQAGDAAERLVAERLRAAGWTILGLNVHVGRAELDIVAVDPAPPARLVVVEVRRRRSREFGLPEETVDAAQANAAPARRPRASASAASWPTGRPSRALPLRIDLVVVEPPREPGGPIRIRHHVAAL